MLTVTVATRFSQRILRHINTSTSIRKSEVADEILGLYKSPVGDSNYDLFCTQTEHGLQTMCRASEMDANDTMKLTAFVHDVGHLVLDEHADGDDFLAEDLCHEEIGADYLSRLGFPKEVVAPIRLHVPAKRYLCAVDTDYWSNLSDGSKRSLELQGGIMSADEVFQYVSQHGCMGQVAAKLRRWEDEGKNMFRTGERSPVNLCSATEANIRAWIIGCL